MADAAVTEWQPHDPWTEERRRTCACGWAGFVEGGECPACRWQLRPKELRHRDDVVRSEFDYQQEFLALRAARRQSPPLQKNSSSTRLHKLRNEHVRTHTHARRPS
jgi:hypothetical protein